MRQGITYFIGPREPLRDTISLLIRFLSPVVTGGSLCLSFLIDRFRGLLCCESSSGVAGGPLDDERGSLSNVDTCTLKIAD